MNVIRKTVSALCSAILLFFAACGPRAATGSRPASDQAGLSERDFFHPPLAARPGVLWAWLNGFVDRDQLTRELEELKAKGFGGAIIWDVGSLADPKKIIPAGPAFLGPESVASISHVIDEAGRLGLELGLFTSSSWNAGGAWIKPENASRQLLCREIRVQGPGRIGTTVPLPDGVTAHWKDVAVLAIPEGGAAIDISERMGVQGHLDWEAPPGASRILRIVASNTGQTLECPSPNSDGLIIDHLSREAATIDMTTILDRLLSVRSSLGALKTFMLDSYEVREAVDWTDGFIDEFRTRHGYDPVPYLPVLFNPDALDAGTSARFLYDYRKTVSDLIIDNHFRTVRDLLNTRGVRLLAEAGHGGYARVDALKALGSADIPMGEFWNHQRFWVVKEAASAAHIYGRRIVDSETLTGWRNWQEGPAEYKRRFDIALCAGLNHPTFHTFTHNPPAAGRPGFVYHAGEHFNVNATWWDQSGPLIEYMSRCDYLLQQGLFVADVAFYYGDQAPNLVPSRRIDPDIQPIYPDTACLHCGQPRPIQTASLDKGYDYDYVNSEVILERMKVSGGRIVLPDGLSYALLVLPERDDMPLAVLRKLGELAEAGATVVGRKPVRAPGLAGYPACDGEVKALADRIWGACDGVAVKERAYGKGRIVWGLPLNDLLRGRGLGPDFRPLGIVNADQHIDFIHRATGREDIYFVSNSAKARETFDAVFRAGEGRTPELWDAAAGTIVPCRSFARVEGGCRLTLDLPAYGSVFVVFREAPTPASFLSSEPLKAEEAPAVTVSGPWTVRFMPGRGAPGSVTWNRLIDWAGSEDPGIRYFSGTATYATEFEVDEGLLGERRSLLLDLGSLREVAEVTLNGRNLGILWKEPFQVDTADALRTGRNTLEVKVTNLWNNRLVGDLLNPGQEPVARTNMVLKPRDLIPAGLFGPVTISHAVPLPVRAWSGPRHEARPTAEAAARALAGRLLPDRAEGFVFEGIAPEGGRDVFEVESRGGRIVVRGSSGVAMASGLNWYLKTVCGCLVSVSGDQLAVPTPLPPVRERVRVRTPYENRYFFNYCTFAYTMAWWDWPQWERMIDWLALNGVNMPLAVTGQEAVWVEVLRELGFDDREIGDFIVGPAYLPWGWMGNIDGLGGPLPETWIRSHADLERKILARERELGMTPVLQGFTGHVPLALKNRYPAARIRQTGDWSAGFSGTNFLDPTDPLFRRIGRLFIEKQTALFGTDHLYAADTFNEMDPPSGDPDFLRSVSGAIFGAMAEADPRAVWVLQGWFLYYSPAKFWTEARSRAFLGAVPDDRMIVLDLFGDQHPIWDKFQAFYGKPWIWNVVHNFGGKTSLNGDLPKMAANLAAAIGSPARGRFAGIGMMMEGFGDNPVVQEFIMDAVWRPDVPPLGPWIRDFARRRYGSDDPAIAEVWDTLLDTAYKTPIQSGSMLRDRPGLYDPGRAYRSGPTVPYDPRALAGACLRFLSLAGRLGDRDTYRLDAVNLTRQVLSNLSNDFVKDVDAAYRSGDAAGLRAAGSRLLEMIEDLDALLATREEFLLGRWLADAKRWAAGDAESRLLEWNARNLITLWGTQCTEGMFDDLNGYAQKQWSGLFKGYDLPRWKAFLGDLEECLRSGRPFDRAGYVREMCSWEQAWSRGREIYPAAPSGDPLAVAATLLKKYGTDIFGPAGGPAAAER